MLDVVVSVCHRRDLWIWRYSQHYIPRYIQSSKYILVVDDEDRSLFRVATSSPFWELQNASSFIPPFYRQSLKAALKKASAASGNRLNYGWYLQQFIKIEYILTLPKETFVLIWDADTLPLVTLNLPSNIVAYYGKTKEFHPPYWSMNGLLLGTAYSTAPDFSFISQFFGVKASVVLSLVEHIQQYTDFLDWKDAVISFIPTVQSGHRFSEYELIGAYIYKHHSTDSESSLLNLLRNPSPYFDGSSLFNVVVPSDSGYDIVAFERRFLPSWTPVLDKSFDFFLVLLSFFFRFVGRFFWH
jgi:hypothetical protein